MSTACNPRPALRAYRITCGGLDYVAMAPSACQAVVDALALHGLRPVIARPLHVGAKVAA